MTKTFAYHLAVSATLGCTACSLPPISMTDLACDAGRCLDGYSCDVTTQRCVAAPSTGDTCASAGATLSCSHEGTACAEHGCRTCQSDLTWSACATEGCTLGTPGDCASCGDDCRAHATVVGATCTPSRACEITVCVPGTLDADGDPGNGCETPCVPSGAEVCDGADNDCSGEVDDLTALELETSCAATLTSNSGSVAAWSCGGGLGCVIEGCTGERHHLDGDTQNGCEYDCGHAPSAEVCDGEDDDCDQFTDDLSPSELDVECDAVAGGSASTVVGWRCAGASGCTADVCGDGLADSDGTASNGCESSCTISNGGVETCADSDDNDCDGSSNDEGASGCTFFRRDADDDGVGDADDARCLCIGVAPYDVAGGPDDCDDGAPTCTSDCGDDVDADGIDDCKDTCVDFDEDGACAGIDDCDDGAASCTDDCGVDNDSDGVEDCKDPCLDFDDDTYGSGAGCSGADCDETSTSCAADCVSDGDDDDIVDCQDACLDGDGDGRGVDGASGSCAGSDCDDADPTRYSGAPEVCDAVDNDCDTVVPLTELDNDGDDYVECTPWIGTTAGVIGGGDCDDTSSSCRVTCNDADADAIFDCQDPCLDADGDGHGIDNTGSCLGADCDDSRALCRADCTNGDGDDACRPFDCKDNDAGCTTGCATCPPGQLTVSAPASAALCATVNIGVELDAYVFLDGTTAGEDLVTCAAPGTDLVGPTAFDDSSRGSWSTESGTEFRDWDNSFPQSCPDTGRFVRFPDDGSAFMQLGSPVDVRGYENLALSFLVGYRSAPIAGQNLEVSACCGDSCTPSLVDFVPNNNDGATDGCRVHTTSLAVFDGCSALSVRFDWQNPGAQNDHAGVDDIVLEGDLVVPALTADSGAYGAYSTSASACMASSPTVICTFDDGASSVADAQVITFQ